MKGFKITALVKSKGRYVIRGEIQGIDFETDTVHSIEEISNKFNLTLQATKDLIVVPNNPHKYN